MHTYTRTKTHNYTRIHTHVHTHIHTRRWRVLNSMRPTLCARRSTSPYWYVSVGVWKRNIVYVVRPAGTHALTHPIFPCFCVSQHEQTTTRKFEREMHSKVGVFKLSKT